MFQNHPTVRDGRKPPKIPKHPHPRRHGRGSEARRRQLENINFVTAGAHLKSQPQRQAQAGQDFQIKRKVQLGNQTHVRQRFSPLREHERYNPGKTPQEESAACSNTVTPDDHRLKGYKNKSSIESNQTIRKRANSDAGEGQQPSKRARIQQEDKQALQSTELYEKPMTRGSLLRLSEEERRAARIKRFARVPSQSVEGKLLSKDDQARYKMLSKETLYEPISGAAIDEKEDSPCLKPPKASISTPHPCLPSPISSKNGSPKVESLRTNHNEPADGFKESWSGSDSNRPQILNHADSESCSEFDMNNTINLIAEKSTLAQPRLVKAMVRKPKITGRSKHAAPVQPNPECTLEFFPYCGDSVPILYSDSIKHYDCANLVTEPDLCLRQGALELLRKTHWTSTDLGREDVPKIGPTRIIDDCDLYFRKGRIYVASERGLLLAADYLKLISVPDTQPVRFNGRKPAWMKLVEARQHYRRMEKSFKPTSREMKEQGLIQIDSDSIVKSL